MGLFKRTSGVLAHLGFLIPALFLAQTAGAACSVHSGATTPHLLELYTSEGCSSCPPAEHWFSGLQPDGTTVQLEFHVDYWDSLGWRDRYASRLYSTRQQMMASHGGSGIVYTPEVSIDGREWREWDHATFPPPAAAPLSLELNLDDGNELAATINLLDPAQHDGSQYRGYIALVEDGLSSFVPAGENRGRTLRHDHVVRAFAGPLPLDKAQAHLKAPNDLVVENASIVAVVTDALSGNSVQVLRLPLSACRR